MGPCQKFTISEIDIETFDECVRAAANWPLKYKDGNEEVQFDKDITLKVDNKEYEAYAVSVAYHYLFFYCDIANIQYDINDVGNGPIAVVADVFDKD